MGISITIFLGSRDPNLIFSLNQCPTDCCLIDPEDVDKFIGALPAFLINETEDILAYTLNIFRQFAFPTYTFQVERASGKRKQLLDECQEKLDELLDQQLNEIVSRRLYRELFLHNSIINIVPASGGFHLSDIKIAKDAPVVIVLDDGFDTVEELKQIKDAVIIAPLLLTKSLRDKGVLTTIAVTNDPVLSDNPCKTELLVIDIVANPKLGLTKSQLIWTSSNSDLDLSHLIEGTLEDRINAYVTEDEFALYVAVELGAKTIFVSGDLDEKIEKRFHEKSHKTELKKMSDFPEQKRRRRTPLLLIDEHSRNLVPKRVLNEVYRSFENEVGTKDVFRALLWAAEYEAVVKLTNGWVDYFTINQVQIDLEKKKKLFLKLVEKVKASLKTGTSFYEDKYKKLVNSLPHACIKSDLDFELKVLLQSNPPFAKEIGQIRKKDFPKELRLEYVAKNKLDLYVRKSSGIFQYFGHDLEYIENKYDNEPVVNIIIIPGLMNAELQLLCLELLPGVPVVTMEPKSAHFAQVLHNIPLISIMGRAGIWLNGDVKDLADAYKNLISNRDVKPLILDPDPQNLRHDLTVLKKLMKIELKDSL